MLRGGINWRKQRHDFRGCGKTLFRTWEGQGFRASVKTSVRAKRLRQAGRDCAESLWLSGRRLSQKSLILSLGSGRAEPFPTAGGAAAEEGSWLRNSAPKERHKRSPRRQPWVEPPSLSPSPLPPARERGAEGGVRGIPSPGLAPWAKIFRSFGAALAAPPRSPTHSTNFSLRTLARAKADTSITAWQRLQLSLNSDAP